MINRINPAFIAYNNLASVKVMPTKDKGTGLLQRSMRDKKMNMNNPAMRVVDYMNKVKEMKEALNGRDES